MKIQIRVAIFTTLQINSRHVYIRPTNTEHFMYFHGKLTFTHFYWFYLRWNTNYKFSLISHVIYYSRNRLKYCKFASHYHFLWAPANDLPIIFHGKLVNPIILALLAALPINTYWINIIQNITLGMIIYFIELCKWRTLLDYLTTEFRPSSRTDNVCGRTPYIA